MKQIQFSKNFDEASSVVYFQVIDLKDSYYVWIGGGASTSSESQSTANFDNLSLAMPTKPSVSCTSLINSSDVINESCSESLARQLAARTGRVCYVSYNLGPARDLIDQSVRALLFETLLSRDQKEQCAQLTQSSD
jgi:Proteasome assembly chaperone 4